MARDTPRAPRASITLADITGFDTRVRRNIAIAAFAVILTMTVGADAAVVRSRSGRTAVVADRYAANFQGLINDLEAAGYRIDFMGGVRAGRCAPPRHKHPCGMAIDINQLSRNVVTRRFPPGTNAMAARHGLFHGALWRYTPDTGHFEVR